MEPSRTFGNSPWDDSSKVKSGFSDITALVVGFLLDFLLFVESSFFVSSLNSPAKKRKTKNYVKIHEKSRFFTKNHDFTKNSLISRNFCLPSSELESLFDELIDEIELDFFLAFFFSFLGLSYKKKNRKNYVKSRKFTKNLLLIFLCLSHYLLTL